MKATSIIFLILAAVLIVSGVIVCVVGGVMANAQDTELLCDITDDEGNDLKVYSLQEYALSGYDISIKNADVNIIGQSLENYIEFKNINSVTYDLSINKKKLELNSVNPFNLSSIVKFRENEGGFDGLRHYLYLGKYKKSVSEINIYLMPDQIPDEINISVTNGDITVKNMSCDSIYNLEAHKGNVVFESSRTDENVTVKVENGNFTFDKSNAERLDFTVTNGNGEFVTDRQFNFLCQVSSGSIYLDDQNMGGETLKGVYPKLSTEDTEEGTEVVLPCIVEGSVTSGDLVIDTVEK